MRGRVAAAPTGAQRQCSQRGNNNVDARQIVHNKSVEGIDSGREIDGRAPSLLEDLIVEPRVCQIRALWCIGNWLTAVGNRIWIDAENDASLVRWRRGRAARPSYRVAARRAEDSREKKKDH